MTKEVIKAYKDGYLLCVTMPHPDGFVFANINLFNSKGLVSDYASYKITGSSYVVAYCNTTTLTTPEQLYVLYQDLMKQSV
jgi:hypothetical protein